MNYNEEISDIQSNLLDEMPERYSKIKGGWLWEMFKAFALKIHELLSLLTDTSKKMNIDNLYGDELDAYVKQWTDIQRKTAQKAKGRIDVKGNGTLYEGTLVTNGIVQYVVLEDTEINDEGYALIEALEPGEAGNTAADTVTSMVTSNSNIQSITNNLPIQGGVDEETDESLKERYHLRLSMPATSGNKAHYILWARECAGVGGAKAVRDTIVNNKVNVYICGDNGEQAEADTIRTVQEYIDPNKNGDGSGVAPVGAICEVFSAGIKQINISGTVRLDNTQSEYDTIENIKSDIFEYLVNINFQKTELSYAKLLNIAVSALGVNDIINFKLNNGYVNVVCEETEIFSLHNFALEVD